ncbi:hypothetical protein AMECASPLE_010533 [Ameca splendens]|uniref:Uncharacterized protein n=1 Tax=Ameca splendens TaxID=208324 RepID=A0ABV0XDN3_9TELE
MDPEPRDPGTYHSPSKNLTEPRGPGPSELPPGVSQQTPKHPAPDTENCKYTSWQRHQPPAASVAGRKLIQERKQPKTQPDTKNRHTQSQSHIPTIVHTHKNTHTLAPNVKTNNNGRHTLTHTPYTWSILPGPDADTP